MFSGETVPEERLRGLVFLEGGGGLILPWKMRAMLGWVSWEASTSWRGYLQARVVGGQQRARTRSRVLWGEENPWEEGDNPMERRG
jgi:hypothetical protein